MDEIAPAGQHVGGGFQPVLTRHRGDGLARPVPGLSFRREVQGVLAGGQQIGAQGVAARLHREGSGAELRFAPDAQCVGGPGQAVRRPGERGQQQQRQRQQQGAEAAGRRGHGPECSRAKKLRRYQSSSCPSQAARRRALRLFFLAGRGGSASIYAPWPQGACTSPSRSSGSPVAVPAAW